MTKTIRKNTILSLLISLIRYLYPVIAFIYIARVLHPEGLGRVDFASAFSSYFVMITGLGMPIYGLRSASARKSDLSVLTGELFLIRTIFGLGSYMLFLLLTFIIQPEEKGLFLIYGIGILAAIPECEWLYKGMEHYSFLAWTNAASRILGILSLLLFVRDSSDVYVYAWISVLMGAGIRIAEIAFADKKWNLQICRTCVGIIKKGKLGQAIRMHLPALMLFFLMSCAVTVYSHTDTVMLGLIKGTKEVGIYSCAAKVKMVLPVITGALWAAALPRSADLWRQQDKKAFKALADSSFHIVQAIIIPLVWFFVLFAGPCIRVIGGEEYLAAVLPMRLLVLAVIPIGISNIAGGQLLIAAGLEKKLFQAEVIGAVSNVIMNAVLIPLFSVSGAAIATTLSEVFVAVAAMVFVKKDMNVTTFDIRSLKSVLISCLIASFSAWILLTRWPDMIKLFISAILFSIIYCMVMIRLREKLFLSYLKTVKHFYKRMVPEKIRQRVRSVRRNVKYLWFRIKMKLCGKKYPYFCPCCAIKVPHFVSGRYAEHPETYNPLRYEGHEQNVNCPVCGALPRHRILAAWCEEYIEMIHGKILYFALENSMKRWLKRHEIKYQSADLYHPADLCIDIEDMSENDDSWDWIFCNHVLEHVHDYQKALKELYRVLKPGGRLIVSFPVDEGNAAVIENTLAASEERIQRFGQVDHYRVFCKNSEALLKSSGFEVSRISGDKMDDAILPVTGPADYDVNYLFLCVKPDTSTKNSPNL